MKLNKWIAALLCAALLLSCAACAAKKPQETPAPAADVYIPEEPAPAEDEPEEVVPEESGEPEESNEEQLYSETLLQSERFSLKLMQSLITACTEENILFSPVALDAELLSLYAAAQGETQEELRQMLECTLEAEDAVSGMKALMDKLDPGAFGTENTLYLTDRVAHSAAFAQTVASPLNIGILPTDFEKAGVKELNGNVAAITSNLVEKAADPAMAADTLMALSGFTFAGGFDEAFDPAAVSDGTFEGTTGLVPAKMLCGDRNLSYYEDEYVQAAALPMGNGRYALRIVLPRAGRQSDFTEAFPQYAGLWLSDEGAQTLTVSLSLPAFTLAAAADYTEILTAMGMNAALDARSVDLSGLMEESRALPTPLSALYSAGALSLSENGVNLRNEAMTVSAPAESEESVEMTCDRPFLCAVTDNESGAVLALGWLNTLNGQK